MKQRIISGALATCMALGVLLTTISPAFAKESTWRGLTYGAGAATLYGAATHKPGLALLGAAGTAYSYSRWKRDVRNRHRRQRWHHRHRYYRHH